MESRTHFEKKKVSNGRTLLFVNANVLQTKRDGVVSVCAVNGANCANVRARKMEHFAKCLCFKQKEEINLQ